MLSDEGFEKFKAERGNLYNLSTSSMLDIAATGRFLNEQYNSDTYAGQVASMIGNEIKRVPRGFINTARLLRDLNIAEHRENDPNYDMDMPLKAVLDDASKAKILQDTPVYSDNKWRQFSLDLIGGAAQLATQMAANFVSGPIGSVATMASGIAGDEYDELRKKGVDIKRAGYAALANAAIQTPMERFALTKLMKKLPAGTMARQRLRHIGENALTEGLTEYLQEYPEELSKIWAENGKNDVSISGLYKDLTDEQLQNKILEELPRISEQGAYSGLIGGILGGGAGALHVALDSRLNREMQKEIYKVKMDTIQSDINRIKETGINPQYAAAAKNDNTQNAMVNIDGSVLLQFANENDINKVAESLGVEAEDIQKAAAIGDTVDVKQGNFIATAATFDGFFQAMENDTAFEDGGYTPNKEKIRNEHIKAYERNRDSIRVEQDRITGDLLKIGMKQQEANGIVQLLTARAIAANPENPAQWIKDNAPQYTRAVSTAGYGQAQYRSRAVSMVDYVHEIKEADIPAQGKGKFFYEFGTEQGNTFQVNHDDMKHAVDKHGLTDEQIQNVEENIENIVDAYRDNKKPGHNTGIPVMAKIKTPIGMAGVSFEFLSNGKIGISSMFYDTDSNIDNWMKKGGSSTTILENQVSFTGNTPLSISNIQNALGIVKYDRLMQQAYTQADEIRKKYEGTDQWLKAPNGKDSNLKEYESGRLWCVVRTEAFKNWFGDWEAAWKKEYLKTGKIAATVEMNGEWSKAFTKEDFDAIRRGKKNSRSMAVKKIRPYTPQVVSGTVIGDVNISNNSISDALHHSISISKIATLAYMEPILQGAIKVGERNIENGVKSHILAAPIEADGKYSGTRFIVTMCVNEDKHGKKFYDHEFTTIKKLDAMPAVGSEKSDLAEVGPVHQAINDIVAEDLWSVNTDSSKVVDENGEPLVVYHGTESGGHEEFSPDYARNEEAIWFAKDKAVAEEYAEHDPDYEYYEEWDKPQVYSVFLNLRNPKVIDAKGKTYFDIENDISEAVNSDNDGVIVRSVIDNRFGDSPNGVTTTYAVKDSTQIKSIDNNGNFDANDPNIYHQIVGEQGAANLDQAEEATTRLDNLSVAREMETAGKDAKAIRLATGWERGADGKWRYEVPDLEIKSNPTWKIWENDDDDDDGKIYHVGTLADIINAPIIFKAYPQLKDIAVDTGLLGSENIGSYSPRLNAISINHDYDGRDKNEDKTHRLRKFEATPEYEEYTKGREKILDREITTEEEYEQWVAEIIEYDNDFYKTRVGNAYKQAMKLPNYIPVPGLSKSVKYILVHEIQHAIQDIEGFAQGSNPEMFSDMNALVKEVRYQKEKIREAENAIEQAKDLGYTEETPIDGKTIAEWRNVKVKAEEAIAKAEAEQKNYIAPEDKYRRTAGEVEARNVQTRMGMSWEERQKTLLADTEDVDRKDQIFLRDSVVSFNKKRGRKTVKYITDEERNIYRQDGKDFISKLKDSTISDKRIIEITKAPDILRKLGVSDNPIKIAKGVALNTMKPEGSAKHAHGLTEDMLEMLPEALHEPVFVLKSSTRQDSIVIFTDIKDKSDRSIVTPIQVTINKGGLINVANTSYGRSNEYAYIIKNNLDGNIIYANTQKSPVWANKGQLQLPPSLLKQSLSVELSIAQQKQNSNEFFQSAKGNILSQKAGELFSAQDAEYNALVERYQNGTEDEKAAAWKKLTDMVHKAAAAAGFDNAIPEQTAAYKIRTGKAPTKTVKVYKVFTMAPDGSPTALFIGGTEKLPQGVWLDAVSGYHFQAKNGQYYVPSTQNPFTKGGKTGASVEIPNDEIRAELIKRGFLPEGSTAKKITALAYRPGWHAGTMPFFPQGGMKPPAGMNSAYENIHRYNQVVFECELAADKDYTAEAEAQPKARKKNGELNSKKADLQYMPENGFYYYATNPMTHGHPELGMWAISGALKINRALTQEECDQILKDNNLAPQEWEGGRLDLSKLGYNGQQQDAARKTLAPITYDDKGNVIPLSERFNPNVDDVRYQKDATVKGAYNPKTNIISLFQGADASTVIHETWHFFVEEMYNSIKNGTASKQTIEDFNKLLNYAGMTWEEWGKADTEGRRKAHERLAEAGETYIMEGKAPSYELRRVFRNFSRWLKKVYETIRRNPNAAPLTDEVREVFDRMLATEEDINEMARINGYFNKLPAVITDGMSDETKAKVEDYIAKAREKSVDILTRQALRNFRKERKEEIAKFRAELLPSVEKEVEEYRVYKCGVTKRDISRYEKLQNTQSNGGTLNEEEAAFILQTDMAAEQNGYGSTLEMFADIRMSPTKAQAVTQRLNEKVQELAPDITKEREGYEIATREAIYNDDTGLLIGVEQALIEQYANEQLAGQKERDAVNGVRQDIREAEKAKKAQERKIDAAIAAAYRQLAKNAAKTDIAGMSVKDAQRTMRFVTAERNAAQKAAVYLAKKQFDKALEQKNLQAYYHAMVQESIKVKRQVQNNQKKLKHLLKLKPEAWTNEMHFAEASKLFIRMGIAREKHLAGAAVDALSLAEYQDRMNQMWGNNDGSYDVADFADWLTADDTSAIDINGLTLEQYNDVIDAINNIKAIAKMERGENAMQSNMLFADLKNEAIGKLQSLKKVWAPNPNKPYQESTFKNIKISLEDIDTFFMRMDGGKEGFFTKTFREVMSRQGAKETAMVNEFNEAIDDATKKWLEAYGNNEAECFGEYRDAALQADVTRQTLVMMLVNLGNKENAQRLCETPPVGLEKSELWVPEGPLFDRDTARQMTEGNILNYLSSVLTKADVEYAQRIIDASSAYGTELNELTKRTKGFGLKMVDPVPRLIYLSDGTQAVLRGGYFPLVRNSETGSHPANQTINDDEPLKGKNMRVMSTTSAASKHRTNARYPLSLYLPYAMSAVEDSIHDICWREAINTYRRLFNDSEFYATLKTHLGPERAKAFREYVENTANPFGNASAQVVEKGLGKFMLAARTRVSNAAIMLSNKVVWQNYANALLYGVNTEGYTVADSVRAVGLSITQYHIPGRHRDIVDYVYSKSSYMRDRAKNPDVTVRELLKENKQYKWERWMFDIAVKYMAFTDNATAIPNWVIAYQKKINAGASEQEAVDFADKVVRRVLGSSSSIDAAPILTDRNAFLKTLTMFQTFFNTRYNSFLRSEMAAKQQWTEGQKRKAFTTMASYFLFEWFAQSAFAIALAMENPFGYDDRDKDWMNIWKELANYVPSMFGPIGQAAGYIIRQGLHMKDYGYKMSALESTVERAGRFANKLGKFEFDEDFAESGLGLAGTVAGVPSQLNRIAFNLWDAIVNDMSLEPGDLIRRRPKRERR